MKTSRKDIVLVDAWPCSVRHIFSTSNSDGLEIQYQPIISLYLDLLRNLVYEE